MNILFVCTGNTCRSPMAEKLLQKKAMDNDIDLNVISAGIFAFDGYSASDNAKRVIKEYGLEDDHITKKVNNELIVWADLILTMTTGHKHLLIEMMPEYNGKVYTLKEYVQIDVDIIDDSSLDITDPFGGNIDIYRKTAQEIEHAIDTLIKNFKLHKNGKQYKNVTINNDEKK